MTDFDSQHRAATTALNRGEFARARQLSLALLASRPQHADAHFLLGMAEAGLGSIRAALQATARAIDLAPSAEYLAQLARLLVIHGRHPEALQAADRAVVAQPADALTLDTIGCVYSRLGAHGQALPLFEVAVAQQPRHPQLRYNLASTLSFLGRFTEAETQYEMLIAEQPDFVKAHAALSALRKQTEDANHIARLEALLAKHAGTEGELHLRYALSKEHEDIGNHPAAFAQLDAANRQHKQRLGYTLDFDRSNFACLMECFAEADYFQGTGTTAQAPIFVMGLPRTGTTLVDRILSMHPAVESAGELQAMQFALKRQAATRSRYALDPETIRAARKISPEAVGLDYLAAAAPHRTGPLRFIDKLPLNFLHAGHIMRALPKASLVCLRRHPMDSIWSNYRHLFATRTSYYDYSYDLLDTASYYAMFDQLMRFWQQHFPGRILELHYESLVDDLEVQVRCLLDHCRLPWDPRCLSFHENAAAVSTPSATQVRQPLYRSALGRWRAYAPQLEAVLHQLERDGIETA